MLELVVSTAFKKDLKKSKKQNKDMDLLGEVITNLQKEIPLEEKYKDHNLIGNWKGYRECHLEPDWLLINKIEKLSNLIVFFTNIFSTHNKYCRY